MEIGGYLELDNYINPMLHDNAIKLNCGRAALAYLIEARKIRKIWLPYFLCESIRETCKKYCVEVAYYHINNEFFPNTVGISDDEYLYIVNFYGQIPNRFLMDLRAKRDLLVVDNTQAYFDNPLKDTDTIYTCRKYFGVSDGGLLYTNQLINRTLPLDESFERMRFVLGRYERNAGEFYQYACKNNDALGNEPIKEMSRLTENLLHAIDYGYVKKRRTENFRYLHEHLANINGLNLRCVDGAFMYPLMIDDAQRIKKELLKHKIYIPTLWPNVVEELPHDWLEWKLAANVLPLPCDQRYGEEEMQLLARLILNKI